MIYILTISRVNPPKEELLLDLEKRHTAPGLEVVRKYVDEEIPNGFTIKKEDSMVHVMLKHDSDLRKSLTESHIKLAAKEKAFLKKQAEYNKDQSLLTGEKPYGKPA